MAEMSRTLDGREALKKLRIRVHKTCLKRLYFFLWASSSVVGSFGPTLLTRESSNKCVAHTHCVSVRKSVGWKKEDVVCADDGRTALSSVDCRFFRGRCQNELGVFSK